MGSGSGENLNEALFGKSAIEGATEITQGIVSDVFAPPGETPTLKPVKPEFRRRKRRKDEMFDLFGTLLTQPQTGALAQQPTNQPKTILGE